MKHVLALMATYNGERFLPEQIDSLLRQKDVVTSILVRDDGPSDGTRTLLEKYQSEGKLQWYTGKHKNVQKSFFDIMKKAADLDAVFTFCDQDNVWDDDKLSVATKHINECDNKKPSLYYCGQRRDSSILHGCGAQSWAEYSQIMMGGN